MLHVLINDHHLLLRAAAPDMVSSVERLLKQAVPDQTLARLAADKMLKSVIYVFGSDEPEDAGKMVVQKIEEATKTLSIVSHIQHEIAGLAQGQEKLLAQGPPAPVEPATDDEARRLFGLLRALELETKFRKAPVTRVFILYCLDGKSRGAVARDCNCSRTLIALRLKAIEKKLGRKAAGLRQISGHFEKIVDSLSDSRARRIDRKRAIEGDDPDDEY
jgi:hypothetical protein